VEIPYERTTLTGYFHPAEEMHWQGARAAVERGYHVMVFDGPGQFTSVHRQGLHFRPDWENVVTPFFDYLLTRKDVDPKRIALYAQSFGGYLAPRAFLAASQQYNLANGIAEQITCPTLVCEAEKDFYSRGQAQELYDQLTCPKTLMKFTDAEGAGEHCEMGAGNLVHTRVYDWLDEKLAKVQ